MLYVCIFLEVREEVNMSGLKKVTVEVERAGFTGIIMKEWDEQGNSFHFCSK